MTPSKPAAPTHAYLANGLHMLIAEKNKARERLRAAFPRRTLIHIHPAGSGYSCAGKAHLLFRLNGEEVNWFTGPPTARDLERLV